MLYKGYRDKTEKNNRKEEKFKNKHYSRVNIIFIYYIYRW